MEILGIGPLELFFIIILALIILGPKDLEKTGKSIGKGLAKLVKSETWKTIRQASDKVRTLPNELMREAGIEEMKKSLDSQIIQPVRDARSSIVSSLIEPSISEKKAPETTPTDDHSEDLNKIAPPATDEEGSK